jgi:uncharacterized protein
VDKRHDGAVNTAELLLRVLQDESLDEEAHSRSLVYFIRYKKGADLPLLTATKRVHPAGWRSAMLLAFALSLVIVAYNSLINRWGPFHGSAYVPANLAFTVVLTALTARTLDLSAGALAFGGEVGSALWSLAVVGAFAVGAFALARSRHAYRLADRRVAGLGGTALAYYVLIRIPLGTAVAEEVIFRGVLFASWREAGVSTVAAAICASAAFGLWHVMPTIIGMRINQPGAGSGAVRGAVVAAVLLTTIAGLGLTLVRVVSGGLLASILVHGGINSVSALAAVRAGRSSRQW